MGDPFSWGDDELFDSIVVIKLDSYTYKVSIYLYMSLYSSNLQISLLSVQGYSNWAKSENSPTYTDLYLLVSVLVGIVSTMLF